MGLCPTCREGITTMEIKKGLFSSEKGFRKRRSPRGSLKRICDRCGQEY